MERQKSHSLSEDSSNTPAEARRRVVKACQRCRLKKCKCDGATPCNRCKADDSICAYGKHKKSDKTVYRKGYVQMLERQHAQLIAGVQELYKRLQTGEGWPGDRLEEVNYNQPLTHKILERLQVLQSNEWDDIDDAHADATWQPFEQPCEDGVLYTSSSSTPASQTPFPSTNQPNFPNSAIMSNRRTKAQQPATMSESMAMPMPPLLTSSQPYAKPSYFPSDMQFLAQQQAPLYHSDNNDDCMGLSSYRGMGMGISMGMGMDIDWTQGMDDLFDHCSTVQPLQTG